MEGRKTDWKAARRAAERIRDPAYTVKDFHDDVVAAFPELTIYKGPSEDLASTIKSRTPDEHGI